MLPTYKAILDEHRVEWLVRPPKQSEVAEPRRATYQDVLDAPVHLVVEIIHGNRRVILPILPSDKTARVASGVVPVAQVGAPLDTRVEFAQVSGGDGVEAPGVGRLPRDRAFVVPDPFSKLLGELAGGLDCSKTHHVASSRPWNAS